MNLTIEDVWVLVHEDNPHIMVDSILYPSVQVALSQQNEGPGRKVMSLEEHINAVYEFGRDLGQTFGRDGPGFM